MSRPYCLSPRRARSVLCALFCLYLIFPPMVAAGVAIAILDFELNDLTLMPQTPEELERTASIKPLLEDALRERGEFRPVPVDAAAVAAADAGFGYLFEHHDAAARLGRELGADWIVVGRVHKPSFLFAYLMAHLIDTQAERLAADIVVEVKGPQEMVTKKGVERLAQKVEEAIDR